LTDGDEVNVWDTDPLGADSDDDGLKDGAEVEEYGTDPADPDSDGGGTDDGPEVGRGTDPTDPTDDMACVYPDEPLVGDDDAPPLPLMEPRFLGVTFTGVVNGGQIEDHDVTTDGGDVTTSAQVVFEVFDAIRLPLCTVRYDLSVATPAGSEWGTESGEALYQAYDVVFSEGESDCNRIDVDVYSAHDLRHVLEFFDWGVGVGPLVNVSPVLEFEVTDDGGDWSGDWEPYVMGSYVTWDHEETTEVGWLKAYDLSCGAYDMDTSVVQLRPDSPPLADHYVAGEHMVLLDLFTILGL